MTGWAVREQGNQIGIQALLMVLRIGGRGPARVILAGVVVWYLLIARDARRHSREWLRRQGLRGSLPQVYRHLLCFATVAMDRFLLASGRLGRFQFTWEGRDLLERSEGHGVLLIGSHLGSFEAMAALASEHAAPVYMVMYTQHARRISAALEGAAPELLERILEVDPDNPRWILGVRDRLRSGAFVAMLADRPVEPSTIPVPFHGEDASFPTGPWRLAVMLRCPVLLCAGLYQGGNRYHVHLEEMEAPRPGAEGIAAAVSAYAARLERLSGSAPYNWFNFYDFWAPASPSAPDPPRP